MYIRAEAGVHLVGNLAQRSMTPRQHNPLDHSLVTLGQAWRPSRTHLGLWRASLLVASDSIIDGGRRNAESSRDGRRSDAALIGTDYLASLFTGELLTRFFRGGNGG